MLDIALKEWAVVCDLLTEGKLALLLRKGGIHEDAGPGRFQLEYQRFALFPAWEHQQPDRIKPAYRDRVVSFGCEPTEITFHALGEVTPDHIWQVPSRAAFDQLDDLHCWTAPQIDMRFNYKPQRPLYLLAVRAYQLAAPQTIRNRDEYAGCKSWVPLDPGDEVQDTRATPALSDTDFTAIVDRIRSAFA
jgi:hypothetical protein